MRLWVAVAVVIVCLAAAADAMSVADRIKKLTGGKGAQPEQQPVVHKPAKKPAPKQREVLPVVAVLRPTPAPAASFSSTITSFGTTFVSSILAAHNSERALYRLVDLTWSDEIAQVAAKWADHCLWEHSTQQTYGENLAKGTTGSYTPAQFVGFWNDEKADYNLTTTECTPGKMCGHFTQVIWVSTRQVGCALKRCPKPGDPRGEDLLVCNYYPPGNYIGHHPLTGDRVVDGPVARAADALAKPAILTTSGEQFEAELLGTHNAARRDYNVPLLRWSGTLAQAAGELADTCQFGRTSGKYGANMAKGTGGRPATHYVEGWIAKAANYNMKTKTCSEGGKCGSFTQVIWRTTTSVGCAVKHCLTPGDARGEDMIVCYYNPPGNFVGQGPLD